MTKSKPPEAGCPLRDAAKPPRGRASVVPSFKRVQGWLSAVFTGAAAIATVVATMYLAKTYELVRLEWLVVPPPEKIHGYWDDHYGKVVISWHPPSEYAEMVREYRVMVAPRSASNPRPAEIGRIPAMEGNGFYHAQICQTLICSYTVVAVGWNDRLGRTATVTCVGDWCTGEDDAFEMGRCRSDSDSLCIRELPDGGGFQCSRAGSAVTCPFSGMALHSEEPRLDIENQIRWEGNRYILPGPDD